MSQVSFVPIPPSELGGAIAVNIFAILSTLGLASVALKITWLLIRRHLLLITPETQEHVFFNTQLGQYAACLLVAMAFSTTSGVIGISWLAQRGITEGWVCRLQATLMQIATWGAGYFTVTIAVHTFNSLVLRRRQSVILCRSTMGIGCIIAILAGLIPFMIQLDDGYVYGADGLTCGVRSVYPKLQFLFHILPILIGSLLSAILYSLIFLVLRGTLKIRGGIQLILNPNERWNDHEENYQRFIARVAKSMLWYPVAYTLLLIPYSIVRLLDISGFFVPFEATVFGFTCWFGLGIVDVLLLYNTFRVLTPAFDACSASAGTRKSMESFYTTGQQKFEYLTPLAPSTSRKKKMSQYLSPDFPSSRLVRQGLTVASSAPFLPKSVPSHPDQNLATHMEDRINPSPSSIGRSVTPIPDYNHIIMPPPSATPISRSDTERRDHEHSPIFPAYFSAPPRQSRFAIASPDLHHSTGTYVSGNEHVMFRQSTQTFGYQDSSQSKTSSWTSDAVEISRWTTRSPHPYILLPKTNEGHEQLTMSSFPDGSPRPVPPPLSAPVPTYLRGHSPLSTLSSPDSRR